MLVNDYLNETFPNLELQPPLLYNWNVGLRFELGVGYHLGKDSAYMQGVYHRAITLFESLHSKTEDIFVVVDVYHDTEGKAHKHKLKVFSPYVKEKSLLYKVNQKTIPSLLLEEEEEEGCKTHRFTLQCKTSDLKYRSMLKAICNHDMGIKPLIHHRVYFININRKTIYHVYDDRGCDLLATSPESIRSMYNRYNDWILNYDREEVEKRFT